MVPAGPPRRHPNAILDAVIPVVLMVIALVVVCVLAVLLYTPPPPVRLPPVATAETPTPDPLLRDLLVAQATWYAPRPTATAAATPTTVAKWQPTVLPYCGSALAPSTPCRWPPLPPPTPTPMPRCETPVPNDFCVWRKP